MSFDIPLQIQNDTPEAKLLEEIMASDHLSAGEAVLKVLRDSAALKSLAQSGIGMFGSPEDVKLMDEVVAEAYEARKHYSTRDLSI